MGSFGDCIPPREEQQVSNLQQVQDQVVHHAANTAAVTFPLMSLWLNAPQILTVVTAVLGVVWYCILIGEKIYTWWKRK